jgi:hypothetical protein
MPIDPIYLETTVKFLGPFIAASRWVYDEVRLQNKADMKLATLDLQKIIDEIVKSYTALDQLTEQILGLSFADAKKRDATLIFLRDLDCGALREAFKTAKGDSGEITRIYNARLDGYTRSIGNRAHNEEATEIFRTLQECDGWFMTAMWCLVEGLKDNAELLKVYAEGGAQDGAKGEKLLEDLRSSEQLGQYRAELKNELASLKEYQGEYSKLVQTLS